MGIKVDLKGQKFGKLTVIAESGRKSGEVTWLCTCACGGIKTVRASYLKTGHTTSCGCEKGSRRRTHGMSFSRPWYAHQNMKRRCNSPNNNSYKDYGARGITYDSKWETFEGFWNDMAEGYQDDLTLDRIDVNGNYCKDNCRWSNKKTQANNTRSNRYIKYNGEKLTISEFSSKYNLKYSLVQHRLSIGWAIEDIISKPAYEEIEYQGVIKTVVEYAKEYGLTYHQLKKRLMRGWTVEKALTQPLRKRHNYPGVCKNG